MNIVVAGGTGLLGSALIARLTAEGNVVTVLTRDPAHAMWVLGTNITPIMWDAAMPGPWEKSIDGADAVINLVGESIAGKRWTGDQKKILLDSRINSTRAIVQAIGGAGKKPAVLINASAVGFYGNVPEGDVDEGSKPGEDFLASLCSKWEQEAYRIKLLGVRVAAIRTGLVLAPHGGALEQLLLPFKLFAGGPLGNGRQWWPWVHIDDEIGIIMHTLSHDSVIGPVNATSPTPVRMKEFARILGRVLNRPSFVPTPGIALRLLLGEMADALLLNGQRAMPKKITEAGYKFAYADLEPALKKLMG